MEYFVSPNGSDLNPGTKEKPYGTIKRGLQGASASKASRLQPGDVLTLFGGTYLEAVVVRGLVGAAGQEITIRSFPGQRAVIDSGIGGFRVPDNSQWKPATAVIDPTPVPGDLPPHPDEWVSRDAFPPPADLSVGAFIGKPYRRLVSYSSVRDFRSDNQTFGEIPVGPPLAIGPWQVTRDNGDPATNEQGNEYSYPWVYMGPGIWHDPETGRVHIRLTHTTNNVPGLEDYDGPTNPNDLALAVCDVKQKTLIIRDSRHLAFRDLMVRFGGDDTILIDHCQSISFDHVEVWASTGGIRLADSVTGATFRNCRFDGGLPPWFFRGDRKNEYSYLLLKDGPLDCNKLGKATVDVLMHGIGADLADVELDHCEFVNGHDLYLVASNTNFHHNWIDNLDDDGMLLDVQPAAGGWIHSNVITRCLAAISMPLSVTASHWYIYRNLIDLREPTAGQRPRFVGDTDVWRFGAPFKSNESLAAPDGPYDLFHNTFLVYDQQPAAYSHYRSALSPHPRQSFNNIFVVVDSGHTPNSLISFIPPPTFPGPTDGNLYHRIGAPHPAAFRVVAYTLNGVDYSQQDFGDLDQLCQSELFKQSKTQYPPGYEANSCLADPNFQHLAADGTPNPQDDLRLTAGSPAESAAITLPSDLQHLDSLEATPTTSEPAGCYRLDSQPLQVGVDGRHRFPGAPPP
jgi:hypothetical protein